MPKFRLRFLVEAEDGSRSSLWQIKRSRNDLYVMGGNAGGVQKFSFHSPNICRLAETAEHSRLRGVARHCAHEWFRHPTPTVGSGARTRVLLLHVGTNTLSSSYPAKVAKDRDLKIIPAAPADHTTALEIGFTNESEQSVLHSLSLSDPKRNHTLLAYERMQNGEAHYLASFWIDAANDALDLPAPATMVGSRWGHLVVSKNDPNNTGRPIRLTIFSNPQDGDFINVCEFGCYEMTN